MGYIFLDIVIKWLGNFVNKRIFPDIIISPIKNLQVMQRAETSARPSNTSVTTFT